VADNGPGEKYPTHLTLDVQGNPLIVTDALDRSVMTYSYDLLGRTLYTQSMDAGERWMLPDVANQPMQRWDSRGHRIETQYDVLRRPVEVWMQEDSSAPVLVEKTVYGEAHPDAQARNLRGRVHQQFDGAGVVSFEDYDFNGNLLRSRREVAEAYDQTLDWSAAPALEAVSFAKETIYDALNRPKEMAMPDASRIHLAYNEAGLLDRVEARLRGAADTRAFVRNIDYDARGQRIRIAYANSASTKYTYDDQTFRLARLRTTRTSDSTTLQDLQYTYDPVGNITEITDDAQQDVFFRNGVASANAQYEYDALYRLTKAEGREQARPASSRQPAADDLPLISLPHPNDAEAVHRYEEMYSYDAVGNLLRMAHRVLNGGAPSLGWTRRYQYEAGSNRLRSTSRPGDAPSPEDNAGGMYSARYAHDAHGNMTAMPHLPALAWDFKDQLREVDLDGGGTVYYVYGADGQRVRKVHEHNGATVEERLYLGGFEVYRKRRAGTLEERSETLHLMDDTRRIALVETKTHADGAALNAPAPVVRYQLGNHLGSASLELDDSDAANVITYEEYLPFGGTSFRAGRSAAETSLKRYRYTGKERDDETGLYYYGARYYAAWLGRWTAADPAGLVDGVNVYQYVSDQPTSNIDPDGMQEYTIADPETGEAYLGSGPNVRVERNTEKTIDEHMEALEEIESVETKLYYLKINDLISEKDYENALQQIRYQQKLEELRERVAAETDPLYLNEEVMVSDGAVVRRKDVSKYKTRKRLEYVGPYLTDTVGAVFGLVAMGMDASNENIDRAIVAGGSVGTALTARYGRPAPHNLKPYTSKVTEAVYAQNRSQVVRRTAPSVTPAPKTGTKAEKAATTSSFTAPSSRLPTQVQTKPAKSPKPTTPDKSSKAAAPTKATSKPQQSQLDPWLKLGIGVAFGIGFYLGLRSGKSR
jgi:RHS repeat-associated protein